jgi:hypothetical protein
MGAKEEYYERAEKLYCLALLFTGDSELSVNLTIETIASEDLCAAALNPSIRANFIAKALASIRSELLVSAKRLASTQIEEDLPPVGWSFDRGTTKAQIENVLLAMDIFPRCALLLTAFEGRTLNDASILMSSDLELVLKGRITGLRSLARSLAVSLCVKHAHFFLLLSAFAPKAANRNN